jgi:hypothetical protein
MSVFTNNKGLVGWVINRFYSKDWLEGWLGGVTILKPFEMSWKLW